MTAHLDALTGSVITQEGKVGHLRTAWGDVATGLKGVGKDVLRYAANLFQVMDIVRYMRTGFNEVLAIDTALTELKKVTDETEASYRKFLQTASQTAGLIGSTVSDFTTATSNFARLGYTMEESADMAQTAIVYKNVADGIDSVEESTESIISTMKAFGIESDSTMGIIDRFNAVGNQFAITSAGIGEALQRSASALYESGNTIDESIALVTAANSVIQNPEQVGELFAQQYSNILLENSYIG
jgi:TP901 family phage tail tape measure protein